MTSIAQRIADELNVRLPQVEAAIALLDGKATVPFIARYRKEATGGLDDTQLRTLEERLTYLRELEDRRAAILKSVEEQGKLTPELAASIAQAETKARLEDLYLPFKPKRRTKAQIAREAGLEPLALRLLQDPTLVPEREAAGFIDAEKGIADAAAALEGARWILMETFAEDAGAGRRPAAPCCGSAASGSPPWCRARRRRARSSRTTSAPAEAVQQGAVASHPRAAARPQRRLPASRRRPAGRIGRRRSVGARSGGSRRGPASRTAAAPPTPGWPKPSAGRGRSRCSAALELDVEQRLREQAEAEAIRVFGRNLHDLLLAAPAGERVTMGLDPGIRTGVKVGRRRRHRQAARHRDGVSARAAQRLGGFAAHARPALRAGMACS